MAEQDPGEQIWTALAEGKVPEASELAKEALTRPITHNEFYYLLSRHPYLEIGDSAGSAPKAGRAPETKTTKTGWVVQDYGDCIVTGPGRLVFGRYVGLTEEEDEEGGGGAGLTDQGTLQQQIIETAKELIEMAQGRWDKASILKGFYGMKRAAWVAAGLKDYGLSGFEPTEEDQVVYNWARTLEGLEPEPYTPPTPK